MKVKSIKINALLNIIYTITNMIFPVITYPYVTRILSASGMGKISFFTSISNYAIMIASLGISTYGIRAVAKVRDNKKELSKVTMELLILNTFVTIITIVFLFFSAFFIDKFKKDFILFLINLLVVAITPLGLTWLFSGLEQYAYITKRNLFFKALSLVSVFLFVKNRNDYIIYAIIMIFSTISSYICNFIYAKKFVDLKIVYNIELRKHLKPMLLLFASILAVSVYTNLDTIMLGFINGDDQVGYYSVASKIKWLLLSAVNAISAVLLPRLSNYISNHEYKEYGETLKKSVSFIFLITIPMTIYFILEAQDSIYILGGKTYVPAIACMRYLMPILIISGISNVIGNQILIPKGKDGQFMRAVVTGAIIDVALNMVLMPKLACLGAAIATLFAECTQMMIQLYFARKDFCHNFNVLTFRNAIISGILAGMVVLGIHHVIDFNAMGNLLITALVYFSLYVLFLIFLKDNYVLNIVKNIKNRLVNIV